MLNVHAGTMRLLALSLVIGAAAPGIAHADPGFRNVVLASAQDGGPETVFRPDTPKIFLRAELTEVPQNAKMTCAWIAAQAVGAPQNYVIDTLDQTAGTVLGMRANVLSCALGKPDSGWPVGSYRVDLLVDGKKTNEAPFEVKSAAAPAPVAAAPAPVAAAPAPVPQAPAPAVAANQGPQSFTIANRTGYDIREVYVSPAKAKEWEDDVLGDDELDDGSDQLIRFHRAQKTCLWDLKVVYSEDESEAVWYDLDLCKIKKVTIRYNSKTDKTSATFD